MKKLTAKVKSFKDIVNSSEIENVTSQSICFKNGAIFCFMATEFAGKEIEIEVDKNNDIYEYESDLHRWKAEWLEDIKEEVDWSKVPVDTKVLVSDDEESWVRGYFAGHEGGKVKVFLYGATSWTGGAVTIRWDYAKLAEEGQMKMNKG